MRKLEFLKRLGFAAFGVPLALSTEATSSPDASAAPAAGLPGMWEATVNAKSGTFHYIYSISSNSYFATGDIDEGFQGFKFSPTVGTYALRNDGSYCIYGAWVRL